MEKAPRSVACSSFQLILWPVSEHEEPNKQRGIHGQSEGAETQGHKKGPTVFRKSVWEERDGREPVGLKGSVQVCACEHHTDVYYVF